ncbi:UNVERIFIED_CONTAM: hypothetical protein FKN15_015145 [Acipenser sinensis]
MVVPSSPEQRTRTDPILQLHNDIFEDMKSLIHPIAIAIASINARLNDTDKQVASCCQQSPLLQAQYSPLQSWPPSLRVQHFRFPTADIPTNNLASAALNGPQQCSQKSSPVTAYAFYF